MRQSFPIRWPESNGWLALSGSPGPRSEIRAQALSRANANGVIACVSLADDMGDDLMDDLAELGAPTGYLVDLQEGDSSEIYERLSTASMIVIEPGQDILRLKRLMSQTAVHALKEALDRRALVLFEGLAATLAGEYLALPGGDLTKGLKFVHNACIAVNASSAMKTPAAQTIHRAHPKAVLIAIARGAALALGPNQRIETWGQPQITFALGRPAEISSENS